MLRNLKIRSKLLLVAVPPAAALAAVIGDGRAQTEEAQLLVFTFGGASALSLMLVYAVGRSASRRLRRLSAATRGVADERLPALVDRLMRPTGNDGPAALAPVGLAARDEIGQMAAAVEALQAASVALASQQATVVTKQASVLHKQATLLNKGITDLFVNLARRNQSLLDRQLQFLDQLEADEQDPDALASLFTLDQYATRMRRNAETLLILAGNAARRWERPISVVDVVRAGVAEAEEFTRVELVSLEDAMVVGNVAVEVAHLLAELFENATRFSPPENRVEVVGRRAEAAYVIRITDRGIGMAGDLLAEANAMLAQPVSAPPRFARSVGLLVAGRLAQRLGASISLEAAAGAGLAAEVLLPAALLVRAGDAPLEDERPREVPFALARM
ncbi:MAG: sensor histidine kinase, partial [Acidimicrobiales bacterium]